MPLSKEDVDEILRIVDGAPLGELQLRTQDFSLSLMIGSPLAADPAVAPPPPAASAPEVATGAGAGTVQPAPSGETIAAPMLGTFYRAEGPGERPFVEVGTRVQPDTIVCIIEVMKMMNSVPAGVRGTVAEVLAENGKLVEFGQPLFRVDAE